jgi:hypothetical protein
MGFADGLDGKKGLIIIVVLKDGRSSKKSNDDDWEQSIGREEVASNPLRANTRVCS